MLVGFPTSEDAGECVADIIAAGIIPGGMEMMDRPAIHAAEAFVHAGYPLDAEALLIVELDGPRGGGRPPDRPGRGDRRAPTASTTCRVSQSRGRAAALLGRAQGGLPGGGPHLAGLLLHGRHHPAQAAAAGADAACASCRERYGLRVANVFHAGDGNLHPLILYDANKPGELDKAEAFGADILRLCVEVGGVLTGEHGVGIEKRDLMPEMFSESISTSRCGSNAPSIRRVCSIPARCFRSCTAAPSSAACTCIAAQLPFPDLPRF